MVKLIDIIDNEIIKNNGLENFKVNEFWLDFIKNKKVQAEIINIINKLQGVEMNPPTLDTAFTVLTKNINEFKIIVSGQDPYPEKGRVKNARAFEVQGLNSWNEPFNQNSLQNIVRLLHKTYNDIEDYKSIKKFTEIREEISNNNFNILSPNEIFNHWERQGVLFINRYPTCKVGVARSHRKIWKDFSDMLFKYIADNKNDMIWFLWGTDALEVKDIVDNKGIFYTSRHPMLCSEKYEDDFLKSNCFKETRNIIKWINRKE